MRNRTQLLVLVAIIALPVAVLLSDVASTYRRMAEYRTRLSPGTSVTHLLNFAGRPMAILHQGEPLQAARRSYTLPPLDDHTAIYFYPKDGMPYFNVYVFIDERHSTVDRTDIENLWW